MRLVLHPQVYSDIDKIMERYERDASRQLADEFYAELRWFMAMAARNPKRFAARMIFNTVPESVFGFPAGPSPPVHAHSLEARMTGAKTGAKATSRPINT